jgi:hypothetical protein
MRTAAAFPRMLERGRKRERLRVCRAAWLFGICVREYRELEAGEHLPTLETYERVSSFFGWPQTFVGQR